MTQAEQNRIAVRALAVAMFDVPVREGETHEDAMDAIVKKMEGRWPIAKSESQANTSAIMNKTR